MLTLTPKILDSLRYTMFLPVCCLHPVLSNSVVYFHNIKQKLKLQEVSFRRLEFLRIHHSSSRNTWPIRGAFNTFVDWHS